MELPLWHRAFSDLPREHGFEPLRVEGRLPEDLRGTLYRNGPAAFSLAGRPFGHWFDGDGAVGAVRFDGAGAQGAVRFVQSRSRILEQKAKRPLFSDYGTRAPWWRRVPMRNRNPANTSVMVWQGRLFALHEGNGPVELSTEDLGTIGESDLGGVVTGTFSAHPHRVRERKASYNFGVRYGRFCELDVFELPDVGPARKLTTVRLSGPTMSHDFIATPNHLIFFAPPLRAELLKLLLGRVAFSESLKWRPEEGTEVVVIPLDAPDRPVRFTAEPFFQWHFSNALEREGALIVDYVRYPDFDSTNVWLSELPRGPARTRASGTFHRASIDPAKRTFRSEELSSMSCEFPRVAPAATGQPHRWAWMVAHGRGADRAGMFDQLARVDLERGTEELFGVGPDCYPSEPVFVPGAGRLSEDDGYLLTLVYDGSAHTSHVAVFDGRSTGEPVARVHFDHPIPFTFHGGFDQRVSISSTL